jgi:hypothetical protein
VTRDAARLAAAPAANHSSDTSPMIGRARRRSGRRRPDAGTGFMRLRLSARRYPLVFLRGNASSSRRESRFRAAAQALRRTSTNVCVQSDGARHTLCDCAIASTLRTKLLMPTPIALHCTSRKRGRKIVETRKRRGLGSVLFCFAFAFERKK